MLQNSNINVLGVEVTFSKKNQTKPETNQKKNPKKPNLNIFSSRAKKLTSCLNLPDVFWSVLTIETCM